MTAPATATKDSDQLVSMSGEEIEKFLREYKELVALSVKSEIANRLCDMGSPRSKIASLRKEREEIESSDMLSEIKSRYRARVDQDILIYEEEIRFIAQQIQEFNECRRKFLSIKFLRPMLLGLLEKKFYRLGFTSMRSDVALAGWTNFVEIEHARYDFAAQGTIPTVFLLGHYRIEITLVRRGLKMPVKIYNLDSLASSTFPHPHINESFDPCFGDFDSPIQKCIKEKRLLHALHLIRIFLSSYSYFLNPPPGAQRNNLRPYASALIECWPEKGSAKPPQKSPREGTSSCDE